VYRSFICSLVFLLFLISDAHSELFKANNYFAQINDVRDVLSGDINGDLYPDLVVVTAHTEGIIIYINDGSNHFKPTQNALNTGEAKDALLEDFDGDGDLDIWAGLLSGEFEDFDALYLNDGEGIFSKSDLDVTQNIFFTGTDELLAGDLDNNGTMDVIRVLRRSNNDNAGIYVFKNTGQANFVETELPISYGLTQLAHFNQDGFLDLWSFNSGLTVYLNDGNGLFNNELKIETNLNLASFDAFPINPILEDIDNDGDVDVQTFSKDFFLPRHLNNGDGTFTSSAVAAYLTSPGTQVGTFLDVDGDQDLDLWYGTDLANNTEISITNDNGEVDLNAETIVIEENQIDQLITDDFDNDGDLDVVSVGVDGINLWEQKVLGQFDRVEQSSIEDGWGLVTSVVLADMNNDDSLDLVTTGKGGVRVATGNGRSGFAALQQQHDEGIFRSHTADLNGDGFSDLAIIKEGGEIDLLFNNQNNGFQVQSLSIDAPSAYKITSGDIDKDGDLDFVVQEYLEDIHVFINQGNNLFIQSQTIFGGFRESQLIDLDQSGDVVLIAQNAFDSFGETTLGVIEYKFINGQFTKARSVEIINMFQKNLVFFDHDGDNDLDILTNKLTSDGYVLVLNNDLEFEASSLDFRGLYPSQAADLNNDELIDLVTDSGDVYLKTDAGYEPLNQDINGGSANPFILGDFDQDSDTDMVLVEADSGLSTLINTTIDRDFTGLWYDPRQTGHGFRIEQIFSHGTAKVLVSWYVYHNGQQMWLTGSGEIINDTSTVQMYITSGPDFGADFGANELNVDLWGTVSMTLTSAHTMILQWDGTSLGYGQSQLHLNRLATIKSVSKELKSINSCHSGSWYNPSTDGQGLAVDVIDLGGVQMVVNWYTYNNGQQYWLTGSGPIVGNKVTLNVVTTNGANFPPDFESSDVNVIPWGEIDFELVDDNHAQLSWRPILEGFSAGELSVQRLSQIDRYICH